MKPVPHQISSRPRTSPLIEAHIHETWDHLTFSHEDLFLGGADIPLYKHRQGNPFFVYVSDLESPIQIQSFYNGIREDLATRIQQGSDEPKLKGFKVADLLEIRVHPLPRLENGRLNIAYDEHGILHLPARAVSPGLKRFKGLQFYWDSSFIIFGLADDGRIDLCYDMVENLLYSVRHYGGPLNANATFLLGEQEPRSQQPLLASAVLTVFKHWEEMSTPRGDKFNWLKNALELLEQHYLHWTTGPHLHRESGLSLFNTNHSHPGMEVLHCEPEHYRHIHSLLVEIWQQNRNDNRPLAERPYQQRLGNYYVAQYLEMGDDGQPVPFSWHEATGKVEGLTPRFFASDWAMRESGFDPSCRFGPMNLDIINHLPVCLNSILYGMERQMAYMYRLLARSSATERSSRLREAAQWQGRADKRRTVMQWLLWDEGSAPEQESSNLVSFFPASFRDRNINPLAQGYGLEPFQRYNFAAAAFAPLWTGVATKEQADRIMAGIYPLLRTPYGLNTSTFHSGCQWDAPILWAPLQVMAVEGMIRYGYEKEALELAESYLNALEAEFERTGALYEKMESRTGTAATGNYIGQNIGYSENDIGFGWTNAAYICLSHTVEKLRKI